MNVWRPWTVQRGDIRETIHYRPLTLVSTSHSTGMQCSVLGFNSNSSAKASGTAGQLQTRYAGMWADFSSTLGSSCLPEQGLCSQPPADPGTRGFLLPGAAAWLGPSPGRGNSRFLSHPSFLHSAKSRASPWLKLTFHVAFFTFFSDTKLFCLKLVEGHLAGTVPQPSDPL